MPHYAPPFLKSGPIPDELPLSQRCRRSEPHCHLSLSDCPTPSIEETGSRARFGGSAEPYSRILFAPTILHHSALTPPAIASGGTPSRIPGATPDMGAWPLGPRSRRRQK